MSCDELHKRVREGQWQLFWYTGQNYLDRSIGGPTKDNPIGVFKNQPARSSPEHIRIQDFPVGSARERALAFAL